MMFKGREIILGLIILIAAFYRLDSAPPLWWDEGWTLSVARNWVNQNHYGRLLNGQTVQSGLEAAFPVTATVALSFRIFGEGIIQARLVIVAWMLGTLLLLYYLARALYNRDIAFATLAVAVLIPAEHSLHAIFMGRQVLGEIPALFFLLAGFAFVVFFSAHRMLVALFAASLCWSFALNIKAQVLPFWACSMLAPAFVAWRMGRRDWASFFVGALVLSVSGVQLLSALWRHVLKQPSFAVSAVSGLYEVTALVASLPTRLFALIVLVLFGAPTLLGLCHALSKFEREKDWLQTIEGLVNFSLFILVSTWFAWYLTISVSWIRYFFPASFLASIFVARSLYDLLGRFDTRWILNQLKSLVRGNACTRQGLGVAIAVILISLSVPQNLYMFYKLYIRDADASVREVAQFLNTKTPVGSLVETYDSELFFFLDRRYHYPPDQLHVNLIRRKFLYEENFPITYNPLEANPDYLVVGPHSKQWRLYDSVVKSGTFRLLRNYPRYDLYERIR
jgi:hypothetical protein